VPEINIKHRLNSSYTFMIYITKGLPVTMGSPAKFEYLNN
jgi:hypothetical protein